MKKVIAGITAFIMAFTISSSSVLYAETSGDSSYRKLIDYVISDGTEADGYSYGTGLETINDELPIDTSVTYGNKPSLRINVTEPTDWWESMLTVRGWCSHDFTQYVENGYIEFNIIGYKGGETFDIGFKDNNFSRIGKQEESVYLPISDYAEVTDSWTHIRIPLKDFVKKNSLIDMKYITCVLISGSGDEGQKFWINGLEITSPDLEKSYPEIKVNQIGFVEDSTKYALVSGFKEELTAKEGSEFHVVDAETGETVYSGKLALVSEYDARDSGEKVLRAGFSDLRTRGTYYISVDEDGIENSVKFSIGNDVYKGMLKDVLRYYYYQRQGDLDENYAGECARNDVTPDDYTASFESDSSKTADVSKGWYDAGDLGKYVNVGSIAVSDLLWAYETYPEQFSDGMSDIPESGNGVSDILDEARWEIEWILSMQDKSSGGFYPRVQGDGKVREIKDGNGCTTDDTACAAAALSEAYISYRDIDDEFADKCLNAAREAWEFLERNPDDIVAADVYEVYDDSMDRLWAAAALFRATNDNKYGEYFKSNYIEMKGYFEESYSYANVWGQMYFTAMNDYLKSEGKDSTVVSWFDEEYGKWLNNIESRWKKNAWGNTLHQGNYYWGVNNQILTIPMGAVLASELLGREDKNVEEFAISTMSWILGANPLRKSFVTGEGEDSISVIYSTIFSNDKVSEVPDGYIPGGANAVEGRGISNFSAKCYLESDNDWVTNEHTIYMNSALVFMTAYMNSLGDGVIKGDTDGNGSVNAYDLEILKSFILNRGTDILAENADMNEDGAINSTDAVLLKRALFK